MPLANLNGVALSYETFGEGPPVVLIPAEGMGAWCWFRQVPAIKRLARLVVFDPPGTGQSGAGQEPPDLSIEAMATQVAALLEALSISRAAVAGLDVGGFVALELTRVRPDLVSRLILASTAGSGQPERFLSDEALRLRNEIAELDAEAQFRHEIGLMLAPGFTGSNPGLLDSLLERWRGSPSQARLLHLSRMAHARWTFSDQGAISVPVLVLSGEKDRYQRPEASVALAQALPNARLEQVPGSGHLLNIERPEVFNRLMMSFVFEDLYPSDQARRGVE